jgi:hypothetical protein
MDVQMGEVGHGKSPSLAVSRVYRVLTAYVGACASRGRRRASRGIGLQRLC